MALNILIIIDFLFDYFPPKAEVRGSNPLGCAILLISFLPWPAAISPGFPPCVKLPPYPALPRYSDNPFQG